MNLDKRIIALDKLGRFISQYEKDSTDEDLQKINDYFLEGYRNAIQDAYLFNNWFTPENLHHALKYWGKTLCIENLQTWISNYSSEFFETKNPKTVAIIMAGNIPLVGFHDFLAVLLGGHKVLAKPSSDDEQLIPFLAQILVAIDKDFAPLIAFADGQLKDFDAVIATGSDNSARYFDRYFGKYPNIIRKNRSSIALIDGNESDEELKNLAEDIFRYFGLGCRNVSKAYIPKDFEIDRIFKAIFDFKHVTDNKKYSNNYDYNRAIYLMEKHDFLENGFFIIKENENLHAPVSVLHYERYEKIGEAEQKIKNQQEQLQCVVSSTSSKLADCKLGESQIPKLWDYADKVDTLAFLQEIK